MSDKPWFNAEKKPPPVGALVEISRDAGLSIMNRVKWNAATPVKGLYWREIEPPEEAVQLAGPLEAPEPVEQRLDDIEARLDDVQVAVENLRRAVKRLEELLDESKVSKATAADLDFAAPQEQG